MEGPSTSPRTGFFELTLNGETVRVEDTPSNTTLADWLRSRGFTGTKQGCAEGDCGACTVNLIERDAKGQACFRAINSCIALVPMVAGRELVTVEGLDGHVVQDAMVQHYGSQCGFCTPGFLIATHALLERTPSPSREDIEHALAGHYCRCTGYVKIIAAVEAAAGGAK